MRIGESSHPGFVPVQVPVAEFLDPRPSREGERVLWSDGTVRGYPPPGVRTVTVLRRMSSSTSGVLT